MRSDDWLWREAQVIGFGAELRRWAVLDGTTNALPIGGLDLVSKDVMPNAAVIAAPRNHARPGQRCPEGAAPKGVAPSRPGDRLRHHPGECSQECLKRLPPSRPQQEVEVRSHVGE